MKNVTFETRRKNERLDWIEGIRPKEWRSVEKSDRKTSGKSFDSASLGDNGYEYVCVSPPKLKMVSFCVDVWERRKVLPLSVNA